MGDHDRYDPVPTSLPSPWRQWSRYDVPILNRRAICCQYQHELRPSASCGLGLRREKAEGRWLSKAAPG